MNKNPFVPQASSSSYAHPQPPLPPGPPPPQPTQPDYSQYWAAISQQPGSAQVNYSQWQQPWVTQPAQPPTPVKAASDPALYANYGYGGQHTTHWQQPHQQHAQQPQHFQHQPHTYPAPATTAAPVAPPPYSPYQPTVAAQPQPYTVSAQPQMYPPPPAQQHYRPQPGPPAHAPQVPSVPQVHHGPQIPQQPYAQQQQQQQHQQHQQQSQQRGMQPSSQNQLPPAKRQRFDAPHQAGAQQRPQAQAGMMRHPNVPIGPSRPHGLPSTPPQQPSQMQNSMSCGMGRGGMGASGRGGTSMSRGGMRGGARGGGHPGSSGGGSNRGMGPGRGRGGNLGPSGSMRGGHSSRDRGSFGNLNRRGPSSFNGPSHHHASFRGSHSGRGGGGPSHGGYGGRSGRDGGHHQGRNASLASFSSSGISAGKKEENRRTLTDFKIVGLEIQRLDWNWGQVQVPDLEDEKKEDAKEEKEEKIERDDAIKLKDEPSENDLAFPASGTDHAKRMSTNESPASIVTNDSSQMSSATGASVARLRIYFHTPPSADDARPILPTLSYSDSRKGKRKKLDDEEDGVDDATREVPTHPVPAESRGKHMDEEQTSAAAIGISSVDQAGSVGRESVAPSVAETTSEADWLMAAITEGDGEADADAAADAYEQTQVELDMEVHEHDAEYDLDESMLENLTQTEGAAQIPTQMAEAVAQTNEPAETLAVKDELGLVEASSTDSRVAQAGLPREPTVKVEDDVSSTAGAIESLVKNALENVEEAAASDIARSPERAATIVASAESLSTDMKDLHTPNEATKPSADVEADHLPEPPASPTSNTAFSGTSSSSTVNPDLPPKPVSVKTPSANRLSISFAAGSRRLLIDAEIVDKMIVFRSEGRIEVKMKVESVDGGFRGILIEVLNDETKAYSPLQNLSENSEFDPTLPPFWKLDTISTDLILNIFLDKERPLSEPKWVKTGDVHDWLKDMFGGRFWVAGDAVGWEKKIDVRYPDPAPTIQTVLQSWASNSAVGIPSERLRFVKTHMTSGDSVLEILLRLVRGERATPFSQTSSAISVPSITGPLLAAMDPSSPHAGQQTHVSLAVVAIVRLAGQYAEQVSGEGKGKEQVDERVGEIIRSLPSHLVYKSLDGIFKEWRAEKKAGR